VTNTEHSLWTNSRHILFVVFGTGTYFIQERVIGRRGGISWPGCSCPERAIGRVLSSVLASGNTSLSSRLAVGVACSSFLVMEWKNAVASLPSCGGVDAQTGKLEQHGLV